MQQYYDDDSDDEPQAYGSARPARQRMDANPYALRPVSAAAWDGMAGNNAGASMYENALFGDESPPPNYSGGDVLGNEPAPMVSTHGYGIQPAAMAPMAAAQQPPMLRGAQKMEQQRVQSAQKRHQRFLNYSVATSNDNSRLRGSGGGLPPGGAPMAEDYSRSHAAGAAGGGGLAARPLGGGGDSILGGLASRQQMNAMGTSGAASKPVDQDVKRTMNSMMLTYDPSSEGDVIQSPLAQHRAMRADAGGGPAYAMPKMDANMDLRAFAFQPGPKATPLLCHITREKSGGVPSYTLYADDGNRFLLRAFKQKKAKTSYYSITCEPKDSGGRDEPGWVGKLRANFVGTEFEAFDAGAKPGKAKSASEATRKEVAAVTYQYNVLGTRGPRKMTGVIPAVDGAGAPLFRPAGDSDTILERLKSGHRLEDLVIMRNKPPRWNEELNAYCLNFNGRVTEASVKNFQLVTDDNHNYVILQFGKTGSNSFTMDYRWPMSAFQAFAICLSSFDNKLACE